MKRFFYRTVLLTALLLGSLLAFPQTKVIVYNGNTTQKENKIFAANLVKSFTRPDLECGASDETTNFNYLLKNQGYKMRNKDVPDTVILEVCEKFEADYLVNFTLYPEKTTKNVKVSLINANTLSVEKTQTFTCGDLKNKAKVKILTDEIAAKFLFDNSEKENKKDEENKDATEIKTDEKTAENEIEEQPNLDKRRKMDGHYLSIGSSFFWLGYYEMLGVAYEYRYGIFGFNASVGNFFFQRSEFCVNTGCKFYLSNKTMFLKNLYFNINPVCFLGCSENSNDIYEQGNNCIIRIDKTEYEPYFGSRLFFGYSPVWRVNKRVSLGINIDFGYRYVYGGAFLPYYKDLDGKYKFDKEELWLFINWDFGFIVKWK
jgi:hypothetical protein